MANPLLVLMILLGYFPFPLQSKVVEDEVVALQDIVQTMGARYWKFDDVSCQVEMVGVTPHAPLDAESDIKCDCQFENNTCHVVRIWLKRYSLPGVLPRELVKLPYLREVDFAYNYLSGGIPLEWASLQLESISLLVNRLSGEIPKEMGGITSLIALNLEANQFTGRVPDELGKLMNLKTLMLSSNELSGLLPPTLGRLTNLTDFRISDNNFGGVIPDYIQNWRQLNRLELHASGLHGPIPSVISLLDGLADLRISDIDGPTQEFPNLSNMTDSLVRLVLRNCNIAGEIPEYLWTMKNVKMLDVSYNNLVGEIPNDTSRMNVKFIFLTGNMLSGNIPPSLLQDGRNIDLSYNNFTWQAPELPTCNENMNLNLNLFRSSSTGLRLGLLPCSNDIKCPQYGCSLHLNCGGDDSIAEDENGKTDYEGDGTVGGGVATDHWSNKNYWGFSATGDFMDDDDFRSIRHVKYLSGSNLSDLYTTARLSPITLTYFAYCLENGNYTVKLYFAEIQFTNDKTYNSLGRRFFDIYIQDKLVQKDFNIQDKAHGVQKPAVIVFNSSVTDNILEIRFNWAGRGTTRIPTRGVYGPLVSAISVNPDRKLCVSFIDFYLLLIMTVLVVMCLFFSFQTLLQDRKKGIPYIIVGIVSLFLVLALLILWRKGCLRFKTKKHDLGGLQSQSGGYTLKQIKSATNNFNLLNKIGEGGFGPVYKGLLPDGTLIAVKQLSSKSKQGNHEFLNEIGMITCMQHNNLVKLHGFCVEEDQLLLVYEYMENNSLSRALFGHQQNQIFLGWETRVIICLGIARGLAFLHEDSILKVVHRDIKATNVLLDKELNPKISDFGLARLGEDEKSHVSTRIAGTVGYMAPEYAIWGHLSYKVDVYSFGILTLEIVSGKSNSYYAPSDEFFCLLDWACHLRQSGNYMELVDQRLGCNYNIEEAEKMVNVALLCTNAAASERPTMSEAVDMLEGKIDIPDISPDFQACTNGTRFKSIRANHQSTETPSASGNHTEISTSIPTETVSSSTFSENLLKNSPYRNT